MTKRYTVIKLSAAVAALVAPALAAPSADATVTKSGHDADTQAKAPKLKLRVGEDFMNFTVGENAQGIVIADHESHASHASHESHASHASHASGM
jgi:hypothetical protein